jgi:hypothetical protein
MTTRIELIPSPIDRLDPLAHAIRWWTSQMIDVFGVPARKTIAAETLAQNGKLRARHVLVVLPDTDAFVANLTLPKGSSDAHANAIKLRLGDLAPISPAQLQISATAIEQAEDGAVTYAVAMARRGRLDHLEAVARRKGAQTVKYRSPECDAAELKSGRTERIARRSLILDGALVAAILAAAVAAAASWTARIESDTRVLSEQERGLRRAVVVSETARRDADIARNFIDRGVLNRRAGALLQSLSQLNKATPDGAWWTSVRWSPEEITISAQAGDATKAIETISANAKSWTVELGGAINAAGGAAPQTFELKLRPRTGAAP